MKKKGFRVLVPLDGSAIAEQALNAVLPLVRAFSGDVTLFSVMPLEATDSPEDRDQYLKGLEERLKEENIPVVTRMRLGDAGAEIVAFAGHHEMDLISMTTHGHTGLKRLLVGSVTEQVLRNAEIPLLVTRPGAKIGAEKRILVPLDGSERAESALPDAVALARALNAELDVIKVVLPIVSGSGMGEIPLLYPSEDAMPYLRTVCSRMEEKEGLKARPHSKVGRAAEEVVRTAVDTGAGLICMTTHGRTGFARFLLGSVAEMILRTAPCPVLVRRKVGAPEPVGAAVKE